MINHDLTIMIIIGGIFILLGIISILWGKKEESAWYGSVSERIDIREFLDRSPGRPEPGSLKTGGKICIIVGITLLLVSLGIYLW